MNPGAAAFLIFLFIVSAFAGLGYLVPEMNRRAVEIRDLHTRNVGLEAELVKSRNTIQAQQDALEQAQAKIRELEGAVQSERAARAEAQSRIQSLQQADDQAQQQVAALQAEIGALRERLNVELASPKQGPIPTSPESFLPWLPPVVVLAVAGGYGLHRVGLSKRLFSSEEENSSAGLLQSSGAPSESPSESIRVFVPRDRIPDFVRWLRQG